MVETWQVLVASIPLFLAAFGFFGKLALDNKKVITGLHQRLLGHPEDDTDEGFIPATEERLGCMEESIEEHAEETHEQLRHIDTKVDTLVDVVAAEHEGLETDDVGRDRPSDEFFRGGSGSSGDD